MGFLDQLKRQADSLKNQQTANLELLARHAALAEAASQATLQYFMELAPQLNVLQPKAPVRFSLDKVTALEGLVRSEFRVDSRRKQLRNQEVFDHLVIHGLQRSGRTITLSKDFPPEIERLEARLRQGGIQPDVDTLRDQSNGRLLEVRFAFLADITLSVKVVPDHDAGLLRFHMLNFDSLESLTAEFPAAAVGPALLDELARWLAGEPHQFLKNAQNLRRVEA